ncbi:lytic murein transglycosylase [Lapillicoccus jejuensis]|uniref:Transglycosylase protein with SLT domain n=1 Tax=Lapillicoccus jejuensis TaxID=402171 RepID=A0A542DVQ2_9MICO|nr:lytic murein transglycosylase [Lapillicoccus jejuensis]TQJ07180.1 transglycosylase protein with SLT domain [Lapillicoccus jejuensis]
MAVVVWFGVVRDDDAIVEWQRQVAVSRRAPATGRLGQRLSRAVGLPVVATGAALLAMLPQVQLGPDLAAPQTDTAQVLALGPVGYDVGLADDRVLVPHDEQGRVVADGDTQDVRDGWDAPGIDPGAASADVAGLLAQDAVDPDGATGPTGAVGADGIPTTVLAAYRSAESTMARLDPSCHLPWWLLAGIGRIESGHASGGRVTADGTTRGRILGPRLDGSWAGTSVILDSDGGALDGDPSYDRAVGPMQFLPGTWRSWGRDGNGDGVADPNNVFDAALGAGAYLCAGGRDLATDAGIASAVLSYNYSQSYLRSVVTWGLAYRDGVTPTQDAGGDVPAPPRSPSPPPGPPATSGTPSPSSPPSSSSSTTSTPSSSSTTSSGTPTSSTGTSGTTTTPPPSTSTSTTTPPTTPPTTTPPTTTPSSCPTPTGSTGTTSTTTGTTGTTGTTTGTGTPSTTTTTSTGTSTSTGAPTGCPTDPTSTTSTTSSTMTTGTGTPSGTGTSAVAPSASGRS